MAPELARPPLADQPWFKEFLKTRGFERTAPDRFTNGRATVRVQGEVLFAVPGDGTKAWRTELNEAPPEAIRQLLTTILAAPSFLSQADLDQRGARQRSVETSLTRLADSIREGPETHSGQQLRRFLWSLYNSHHVLNLWQLKGVLDGQHNEWVTEVFTGAMQGFLSEDTLRRALTWSGEMARWDTIQLSSPESTRLDEAVTTINELLRRSPPGHPHSWLTRAQSHLFEAQESLKRAAEPA